ncbi:unnamed protein product (mitochondrion) [Plasmodiophora brassicae]|uniref:TOG domain-containing protein n=1 Tax=Plasmodiophora brassicae TaxID=37360 RepID=A0A0G4IZM7_PLABS|nr:hypothetical protein PBRA_001736 [Plasmodiophora brassicae]SPQ93833.1 unnamed protein product [Plasmodiophora brassicae]
MAVKKAAAAAAKTSGGADNVERIYAALEQLKDVESAGSAASADAKSALDALVSAVGSEDVKVRNLLATEIPTFLHYNPSETAINALFDLCEDTESIVRISAIKGLQRVCEKSRSLVGRISDVLAQLLCAEDAQELKAVHASFAGTMRVDFAASIVPLVDMITNAQTTPATRSQQVAFLREHLPAMLKQPSFKNDLEKHRLLVEQFRRMLMVTMLLTKEDVKFVLARARTLKLCFTNKQSLDDLSRALVESFKRSWTASTDLAQVAEHFSTIWSEQGPKMMKGESACDDYLDVFTSVLLPALEDPKTKGAVTDHAWTGLLRVLHNAARGAGAEACRNAFTNLWPFILSTWKRGRMLQTAKDIAFAECLISAFISVANKAPGLQKTELGIFVPTGQPSDQRSDLAAKKEQFNSFVTSFSADVSQQLKKLEGTAAHYQELLREAKERDQQISIKESITKLREPIRALKNLSTMTADLLKPKPVFTLDGITMSWRSPQDAQPRPKPEAKPTGKKGKSKKRAKPDQKPGADASVPKTKPSTPKQKPTQGKQKKPAEAPAQSSSKPSNKKRHRNNNSSSSSVPEPSQSQQPAKKKKQHKQQQASNRIVVKA